MEVGVRSCRWEMVAWILSIRSEAVLVWALSSRWVPTMITVGFFTRD